MKPAETPMELLRNWLERWHRPATPLSNFEPIGTRPLNEEMSDACRFDPRFHEDMGIQQKLSGARQHIDSREAGEGVAAASPASVSTQE